MRLRPFAAVALLLSACASTIDGPKARALVRDEQAVLLDVRSPEEFDSKHLDGALNIPVDELEGRLKELEAHKAVPIVVYCRSGMRSAKARKILLASGFSRVENLGSLDNW